MSKTELLNELRKLALSNHDIGKFGDGYEKAINEAIRLVKNCSIPDLGQSLPTDSEIEEMANEIPFFPPLNVAKEHRAKWIQGAKALRNKLAQRK